MSSIPIEDLRAFHKMERELFTRFIFEMGRDPMQSMQVIALWLWLEEIGFPNIISKIKTLSDRVVETIIEEAEICLNCLHLDMAPPNAQNNIPITTGLMEQSISLNFLHENKDASIIGISSVLKKVCFRIFEDILGREAGNVGPMISEVSEIRPTFGPVANMGQETLPTGGVGTFGEGTSMQGANVGQMKIPGGWSQPRGEGSSRQGVDLEGPEIMMGREFERLFRSIEANLPPSVLHGCHELLLGIPQTALSAETSTLPQFLSDMNRPGEEILGLVLGGLTISEPLMQSALNPLAQPWALEGEASQEDRNMFLTFSRGYPLAEEDIRDFFKSQWGNCIQSFYMQETPPGVQPLFARLVLYSSAMVPTILAGREKAKLVIKGRHVWVRPYIPKKKQSPSKP